MNVAEYHPYITRPVSLTTETSEDPVQEQRDPLMWNYIMNEPILIDVKVKWTIYSGFTSFTQCHFFLSGVSVSIPYYTAK